MQEITKHWQMLNVHFGGSLTQDLKYHAQSSGRWQKGHEVFVVGEPRKQSKFEVNSHHHQAVLYSDLSDQLEMIVYADNEENINNCIVEALRHKQLPIIGVNIVRHSYVNMN